MRHDDQDEERRRCGLCGKVLQPYDSISVAEVGERCSRCFNKELAERLGVDFDDTPIAPIVVTDVDGVRHRFEIQSWRTTSRSSAARLPMVDSTVRRRMSRRLPCPRPWSGAEPRIERLPNGGGQPAHDERSDSVSSQSLPVERSLTPDGRFLPPMANLAG